MCGNGGRCLTQFAYDKGIHKDNYHFMAVDGEHHAFFGNHGWIHLQMTNVDSNQRKQEIAINTKIMV